MESIYGRVTRTYWRVHPGRVDPGRVQAQVTESFVDSLFDDRAEFDRLVGEFVETEIGEICATASAELEDEKTLYDIHREECARYYALVRKYRPDTVVETGVYNGVSTLGLLLALERNGSGRLHSIDDSTALDDPVSRPAPDDDAEDRGFDWLSASGTASCCEAGSHRLHAGKEPGWIVPERLRDRWTMVRGASTDHLPALLDDLDRIDVFLHDSTPDADVMRFELETAWDHLADGGLALSHHTGWNDVFERFAGSRQARAGLVYWRPSGADSDVERTTSYAVKDRTATDG